MSEDSSEDNKNQNPSLEFLRHLGRAAGGAILFSFPILMTMETWFLGFSMNGLRLALFTLLTVPLLVALGYYDGFEQTSSLFDDVIDTFVAYAVGFVISALLLLLFGIIKFGMSADEIIGKILIQAIIASFGAMFAKSLLTGGGGGQDDDESDKHKRNASYFGEIFLMAVGAIFLSLSVAPTEEIVLITYQMSDWLTVGLAVVTLMMMYAFVYAAEFRGHEKTKTDESFLSVFLRYTVVGYAVALIVSFYVLWSFGTLDGMDFDEKIKVTIVLAFPAAIGVSASRLIL